jgi:hypothetical protein
MAISPTDPSVLIAVAAGTTGLVLLLQARVQSRLLRRRIASGDTSIVVDPETGLYSAAAAWQCIRAEANRALRLGRPLDVWVGTAEDAHVLDIRGRELVFDMPAGAMGIRIAPSRICVVTCAGAGAAPNAVAAELAWRSKSIDPGDDAAATALAFVAEEDHDA